MLIDKQTIKKAFTKAIPTYKQEAVVQNQIAENLLKMLSEHLKEPVSSILEIGCGTGFLTQLLQTHFPDTTITTNDLCPEMSQYMPPHIKFISGDMETTEFPDKYDLITGSSAIQWLTNLPSFLAKINQNLIPNGIIAFSTFGEKNLKEIKHITGIGLSYYTKSSLEQIISSTFQIIELKEEIKTLYFPSPRDVLTHMKRSGINGITSNKWTKSDLQYYTDQYKQTFNTTNGVSLTYHPIYIIASKK